MPWRDLTTQPIVANLLQRSMKNGRTHHAYLLKGDSAETFKVARMYAQALNCEKNDTGACGKCSSCEAIEKGSHPDMKEIKPESKSRKIVVDQIREMERSVHLKATMARMKVGIIRDADRMNEEAQNSFLKTLEEPPPSTSFLLLTEEPWQLKETIISRCLPLSLRPVPPGEPTEEETLLLGWLEEFHAPLERTDAPVYRAYGLTGRLLGLLKGIKENHVKEAEESLKDPSFDYLDKSIKSELEDQAAAQAQAEYIRSRARLLKRMLEWHRQHQHPVKSLEVISGVAHRLATKNVNESLAVELAILDLMGASQATN